jgi:hypothetical protein
LHVAPALQVLSVQPPPSLQANVHVAAELQMVSSQRLPALFLQVKVQLKLEPQALPVQFVPLQLPPSRQLACVTPAGQ